MQELKNSWLFMLLSKKYPDKSGEIMGNAEESKNRIKELVKLIEENNQAYYEDDSPKITDAEYDELIKELTRLEASYPELVDYDSPLKKVGGKVSNKFSTYSHRYPLLSLNNAFSYVELREFDLRVKRALSLAEEKEIRYIGELKIDGLSIALIYQKGQLVTGATRGDGLKGENVTRNIWEIKDIPKKLMDDIDLEVRGEVYMDNQTFDELNEKRLDEGLPLFRNPRNGAAGSLRQLDELITRERNLKSFIYEITYIQGKTINNQKEALEYLSKSGFHTNEKTIEGSIEDIIGFCEEIKVLREKLPYGIDGVVVKVENIDYQLDLGSTEKSPKWAIAYKFPPEQKETIIKEIEISVGRTGVLTPMASLEPTLISGSMVKRATLHNEDYIREKDIRPGDTVLLQKAGDVIPEIVRVVKEKRPVNSVEFKFPDNCPVCGSKVIKIDASIRCTGELYCPAQLNKGLIHFVSRDAMNIDGLGEKLIEYFVQEKLIADPADIYKLKKEDLHNLDGLGEKSAQNIINAIEESKTRGLGPLLYAFGIPLIGSKGAKVIAKKFKSMELLINTQKEEYLAVPDVGEKMADSLVNFFKEERNLKIIADLKASGIIMEDTTKALSHSLDGLSIVITGSFSGYDRKELSSLIELHGGKASTSVSKKTSFVLAGTEAGSKLDKAVALGIEVIDLNRLWKLIEEGEE